MSTHVTLRNVQRNDLPIFFDHQADPEATRQAAFPARSRDQFMAHWAKIMAEETNMVQSIVFEGNVAGNIVCWEQAGEHKVGFWLGKEFWGKGIASAALAQFLKQVKVRPLYAHVAKHNAASIRVLQKGGFLICREDTFSLDDGEQGEEFVLKLESNDPNENL